jgi:hypothetical protein
VVKHGQLAATTAMMETREHKNEDTPELHGPPSAGSNGVNNNVSSTSDAEADVPEPQSRVHRRRFSRSGRQEAKHIRLQELDPGTKSSTSSIYYGSFNNNARRSKSSIGSRGGSVPPSLRDAPRASMSHSHLESLLQNLELDLETYGVDEMRDGFFDGSFTKPAKVNREEIREFAEETLPDTFKKEHPLSPKLVLLQQWRQFKGLVREILYTRAGIKLTKSFLGFFIAYILCLVPVIMKWLGRYSYIMVISALIVHPGRTVGAQIDGAVLTTIGTAGGLGWGAFALWISDSSETAKNGYGGILAAFLVIFMGSVGALRSYYVRIYQLVLCAGIAVIYTCLADTSESVNWGKLFDYGIPWLFGQAISLIVCCTVFPDAGARPLAVSLHDALRVMQDGLILPHPDDVSIRRQLALTFVNLSQAHRDITLDISITRFPPSDVVALRNLMQGVIRSLLSLKMQTALFDSPAEAAEDITPAVGGNDNEQSPTLPTCTGDSVIDINRAKSPSVARSTSERKVVMLVTNKLSQPTMDLISCMKRSFKRIDAVLMDMSGYRRYMGPDREISSDIIGILTKLRKVMIKYDEEEQTLMDDPAALPPTYSEYPEVVELFLFVHPVRQAARSVEALLVKVMEMQQRQRGWKLYLPSYPLKKGLQRTNAQVRHDRGGVTAGFYFRSQTQLAKTMRGMANIYKPLPHLNDPHKNEDPEPQAMSRSETMGKYEEEEDVAMDRNSQISTQQRFRYRLWLVLHRLQGFETRFALKVIIMTSLLAVPAWLPQSRGWWNKYESWWCVAMVWIMSHPRVGGNVQDVLTRALCAVIGAVSAGLAYAARNGNPYVMAVFAAIYMIPMMYRFTQSSHPRSGIVGCISFVVVSLAAKAEENNESTVMIAWTRGTAFVIGVVTAVTVSSILWPFVARHELRKALSAMMIYSSIIYRGVVARYVYYEKGNEPGEEDIKRSGT